ncbi:MAG: family 10 glycosylhydrolase [Christensenellales bacterium]
MIQNNLRDIDAAMDVGKLVDTLESFDCNCVMVGAAGISSFFESSLPYQTPSPYLNGRDTLGEIVETCHARGIRVIARFDFSKTHERLYEANRDWYYKSAKGEIVRYNDTVHTCICGEYQQKLSLEIIREVLEKYPVDGIFFNMFGFMTRDYSNNEYGICHCDACKTAFRAHTGLDLPEIGGATEVWDQYRAFQEHVVSETLRHVHELVRSFSGEIAICTYHHAYVDMVRNESNSAVDRPYPFWLMNSASNVDMVRSSWNGTKISSNCVINATDIFYRFTGVSKELNRIRLYEEMAAGGVLDWCIIGVFEDYPDEENYEYVREVFRFHRENERYFGHFESLAKVAVVQPISTHLPRGGDGESFLGVYKALKEAHIPFDVLALERIEEEPALIDGYDALIYPAMNCLYENVIDLAQARGILNVFLGLSKELSAPLAARLQAMVVGAMERDKTRAAYLNTREKDVFTSFEKRHWIIVDDDFGIVDAPEYRAMLPMVNTAWYGPPERCFGHTLSEHAGALYDARNKTIIVPWDLGGIFYRYGFRDHSNILTNLLDAFCPSARVVRTSAPEMVELFVNRAREDVGIVQLLNLTGANGTSVGAHIPVHGIEVELPADFAGVPRSLTGGQINVADQNGKRVLRVQCLEQYEAVVFE